MIFAASKILNWGVFERLVHVGSKYLFVDLGYTILQFQTG